MVFFFFFKQKTAYEMRISDWSSDVCSSDLAALLLGELVHVEIPAEQLTHVHRHRAVEEYRKVENAPRSLEPIEVKEQRLRTVDGEGGYDDRAAPRCPPRDRKSTRLNSSHSCASRLPSSA